MENEGLKTGLTQLQDKAGAMIPQAVKDLDQQLRAIQHYVRSGGETTARTVEHVAASGGKAVPSYAEELKLLEEGAGAVLSAKGGWVQNVATGDAKGRAAIAVMAFTSINPGFPTSCKKWTSMKWRGARPLLTSISSGNMQTLTVDGTAFSVMPTGWKDANGVWGYLRMPGPATVQTMRLGARERATKDERSNAAAGEAHAH